MVMEAVGHPMHLADALVQEAIMAAFPENQKTSDKAWSIS